MENGNINILETNSYLAFCARFFEKQTVEGHLKILEQLIECIANEQYASGKIIPTDAFTIYQLFAELFEASFQFKQSKSVQEIHNSTCPDTDFPEYESEKGHLTHHLQYLCQEELIDPLRCFDFLNEETVVNYKNILYDCLRQSIHWDKKDNGATGYFLLYLNTRKLIVVTWLLYNRFLENNDLNKPVAFSRFEDTCPLLLISENQLDPYLEVESFFNGAGLGDYRAELRCWFKTALTENVEIEHHANLIYFHNQIIQLLQAGYLIAANNTRYVSVIRYSSAGATFKDWVNGIRAKNVDKGNAGTGIYDVYLLSEAEIANPLVYLKQILTLQRIADMRDGLQEWIYCAFNGKNSIATMEAKHVFHLYEDLEKIFELLFLLIAGEGIENTGEEAQG